MPKVLSVRFALFLIGFLLLIAYAIRKQPAPVSQASVTPIRIFPYPQNGYGSADNQLAQPDDVELQSDGHVIITDVNNNRIQYFDQTGKLLASINGADLGFDDPLITPTGIGSDSDGYIYITLEDAGTIARFTADMQFDQFIGHQGQVPAKDYYLPENDGLLMKPQGIIVAARGDVYVVDMAKKVFEKDGVRNFGFRRFNKVSTALGDTFVYDTRFAKTQEITRVMRKSEGMAISEKQGLLFVAEEKPSKTQFGNADKYRYIGVFDAQTGVFMDRLIGVTLDVGVIVSGYCSESIEGLAVAGDILFAVAEKAGRIDCYDIASGKRVTHFGSAAPYYCDDESDCVIDGVNYNEQAIIAGTAKVHLLNDWHHNELASPDGICSVTLKNGQSQLAVVDQWNSRILHYDLDQILGN